MSQAELAELVEAAPMTVHRWERGSSLPCGRNAVKLMEVLGIQREEFEALYEDALMNTPLSGVYAIRGSNYVQSNFETWTLFLEWLIALDYRCIPGLTEGTEGTAEQWVPLFQSYPSCWRVLTHNDLVVGYWHYLPLKKQHFELAMHGELRESDLSVDMADFMIRPGRYLMYITMFLIDPVHRTAEAWNLLRKSFLDELFSLSKAKFFFSDIACCALSIDGIRLCETLSLEHVARHQRCAESEVAEIYHGNLLTGQPPKMFLGHTGLCKAYAKEFTSK